jgi:hypothetical protein
MRGRLIADPSQARKLFPLLDASADLVLENLFFPFLGDAQIQQNFI